MSDIAVDQAGAAGAGERGRWSDDAVVDRGLGSHLDRLLRAAEQEAEQVREAADRRAAALLTEAHAEITRHEHERSRSWDDREAAVAAAEERVAAALTTAHEEAAQLVAAAHAEAHRVRSRAQLQAREITEAAEQEAERLVLLRDSTRAEIQRLFRTLDGIRDALAYELQTGVPIPPQARQDADRQAVRTTTSAGAAAIGRRRGDLHRTRHIGLSTVDDKPTDDGPRGVG